MNPSDIAAHRSSTGSRDSGDDEEGFSFSSLGKTPRKNAGGSASSRRFCLSTIGLPKRPDTKFRKQDFSGQLRSSISRKCQQRQSGPLFSGIEAVLTAKRGNTSLKIYDPGSPDVSCLGRIKLKQKDGKGLRTRLKSLTNDRRDDPPPTQTQKFSWLKKWFTCRKKVDDSHRAAPAAAAVASVESNSFDSRELEGDDAEIEKSRDNCASCPPTLGQMKRFASQREPSALSGFSTNYAASESEKAGKLVEDDEEMKKMESTLPDIVGVYHDMDFGVSIPYPPPAEINLWKRRSVAPPVALDLKPRHPGIDMRRPMTV